ncbi:MAG: hypothetical protein OXI64_05915 [Defluviicoccus sp.]|nr:hypothetical protein [Defluviicoccus sp.]MDE0334476.1 hypothetical protein [Defluviicoccus sp.]
MLSELQRLSWAVRRKPLEAFLLPVAAVDGRLLCRDSSLVSMFRIEGSRALWGGPELERFVEIAAGRLNSRFMARGHALHATFEREADGSTLAQACEALGRRSERLGLGLGDVFGERARRPPPAVERFLLACWTRPSAASPLEAKSDKRKRRRAMKGWLPPTDETQCPVGGLESLEPRHDALVEALEGLFSDAGIVAARLSEEQALAEMRRTIDGVTEPGWKPRTADGEWPARVTEPAEWGAFPPPLAPQLIDRDAERMGLGVAVGERLYGTLDMCLGPRTPRPFAELLDRMGGLPFRLSILAEGGGLDTVGARVARLASSFLAFSSDESDAVKHGMEEVTALAADAQAVVRLRLSIVTWVAREEGPDALLRRMSRVEQLVEGWGECVFSALSGDQVEALTGTIPGFACGGTAPSACAPLREVLGFWAVGRPAALSERADHVFRSADNKLLPFSYAGGEDYGFELIHGIPERGKSVLMNCLTLAHLLQGTSLPFAATIDIGPSSAGLISMIREALPVRRRGEAAWFRLSMEPKHAINPCDTPLGCRAQLEAGRAFLVNLLGLIFTPAGAEGVPDGVRETIGPAIDAVYAMRSDERAGAEPHRYSKGRDERVDEALEVHACRLPEAALWWEVVDALFQAGDPVSAGRAQRFAVPVLSDLLSAVRDPGVQGLIEDARYGPGGETVTQAFSRVLTGLAATWPSLFQPTRFDIGGARVVAVDLSAVAPTGSAEADRQTAAFYMVARQLLTRDWWTGPDEMEGVPQAYRAWHVGRARALREAPKRLAYDEFHRTAQAPAVRGQVERDVREARKMRVRLVLASQRIEDFGETLVELANRYWILGAGGQAGEIERLAKTFGLSETVADVVRLRLNGPGPDGAPALLIASDRRGRFEQLVLNTPGAVELWALTTSPADVALRQRVGRKLRPAQARAALAARFPRGTARGEIDEAEARGERDVVDRLAAEVVALGYGAEEGRAAGTA